MSDDPEALHLMVPSVEARGRTDPLDAIIDIMLVQARASDKFPKLSAQEILSLLAKIVLAECSPGTRLEALMQRLSGDLCPHDTSAISLIWSNPEKN
jgi:hypothetical protein